MRWHSAAGLWALLAPGAAHAFCGTYVAAPGSEVTNTSSHVVVGRVGTRTTLTLANDFAGEVSDFALVIPVPEVLLPEDVRAVSPSLIERIETYSTPRVVAYTCEDAFTETHWPRSGAACGLLIGCAEQSLSSFDTGGYVGDAADDSVTVEAAFTEAEYDIVVLSAEESSGLLGWLDANGYALPEGGEPMVQSYIDSGSYFLAAKVRLDALPPGRAWLSPLQIAYDAATLSLPIRIGTIASTGEQDMIVTVLADANAGEAAIANYPEVPVEDECMWRSDEHPTFGDYYASQLDAVTEQAGAGWFVEYSWDLVSTSGQAKCDPCTSVYDIPPDELDLLGADGWSGVHLTRLRMRYRPDAVDADVAFYFTNQLGVRDQMRFIQYVPELEFLFPVCGEGWVEDPGQCEVGVPATARCDVASGPITGLLILVGALVRRRRA